MKRFNMPQQQASYSTVSGIPIGHVGPIPGVNHVNPVMGTQVPQGYAGPFLQGNAIKDQEKSTSAPQPQPARYNDLWAAVLWVTSLVAVVSYGTTQAQQLSDVTHSPGSWSVATSTGYFIALAFCALAMCFPFLFLIRSHAEELIYFGNIFYMMLLGGLTLWTFLKGAFFAGILSLIVTIIYPVWFFSVQHRIPFAALCVRTSAQVVNEYKAMILNAFGWMLAEIIVMVLWAVGLYSMQTPKVVPGDTTPHSSSGGIQGLGWVWLLFLFWNVQVMRGIVHTTTSGVMGMWYFTRSVGMPKNPTLGALHRATRWSLGSICLGSLVVAILRLARFAANQALRNKNEFVQCIANCILGFIESMMEYFNQYALVHVALYGKPYIEAAKDTWELVKSSGIAAIINDQLLQAAFVISILTVSLLTGAVGFVFSQSGIGFLVGFLVGLAVTSMMVSVVQSGVMTIFVCYAEHPTVLQATCPPLYEGVTRALGEYTSCEV